MRIFLLFLLVSAPSHGQFFSSFVQHFLPLSPAVHDIHDSITTFKNNWSSAKWNISHNSVCSVCRFGFSTLQTLLKLHLPRNQIANVIENICIDMEIQPRVVCRGLLEAFKNETFYVLDRVPYSPSEICNFVTGYSCADDPPGTAWTVQFPNTPKPPTEDIPPPEPTARKLRVLHLSDLHFDMYYKEGTNAQCGNPLCCRNDSGPIVGAPAGRWGDARKCDAPVRLIENMLSWIAKREKVDFILWTGDLPAHDIWNQTKQMQLIILKLTTKYLRGFFPNTPVFPALGNHEGSPVDSFPPRAIIDDNDVNSVKWLYEALANTWNNFGIPPESLVTVSRGGYYRVSPYPGLRIISLNTNMCNTMNWWLLLNMTDPDNHLQWLINELQEAENAGDKVHLIGHIPPGSADCMKMWSLNYYRIIARYQNTIRSQFYGHEHIDSVHVYYDPQDESKATGLSYLGPSVTPFHGLNPGYRIYTVDGGYPNASWVVLDHETYIANLTAANEKSDMGPQWVKEYSAKKAYGMEQLLPKDWDALLKEMENGGDKFDKFWRYYWKSDDESVAKGCDADCRKHLLCVARPRNEHCVKLHD